MTKESSENLKDIPDSHLAYGKKRMHEIRAFAQTKFGDSLIIVKANREKERFEVIVQKDVKQSEIAEFEELWTMCKVLKVS